MANATLFPAYQDGDEVEYFSISHRQWLLGVIRLNALKEDMEECFWNPDEHEGSNHFWYSVELKRTRQVRGNVKLDMVRPVLQFPETVDVFSKRDGGQWLCGVMSGRPPCTPWRRHYSVSASTEPGVPTEPSVLGTVLKVPAARLRRRFPGGSSVDVYRGPVRGWTPMVVHPDADTTPVEHPVPLCVYSPGSPAIYDPAGPPAGKPGHSSGVYVEDTGSVYQGSACSTYTAEDGLNMHPWIEVPVYEESCENWLDGEEDGDLPNPEWIPSYLVRMLNVVQYDTRDDKRIFKL